MSEQREGLYSSSTPLLLGLATLVLWFGFQTTQLLKERENMSALRNNQTTIYNTAQKMRTQLDAIATEIINTLKARGITIDPNATQ